MQVANTDRSQSADAFAVGDSSLNLLKLAQTGSHPAFETLCRTYSKRLFNQIIAITKHHEDAEDALQDALCNAYFALPFFERRCHIYSWLSRIAINSALLKVRQRRTSKELPLETQADTDGREFVFDIADQGWSPEDLYTAEESLRQIGDAISSLDPASQQVLHLRVGDEYSIEEIANALNVTKPAVKARLHRARHVLRNLCRAVHCEDAAK